jgi:hypothetical protein
MADTFYDLIFGQLTNLEIRHVTESSRRRSRRDQVIDRPARRRGAAGDHNALLDLGASDQDNGYAADRGRLMG